MTKEMFSDIEPFQGLKLIPTESPTKNRAQYIVGAQQIFFRNERKLFLIGAYYSEN